MASHALHTPAEPIAGLRDLVAQLPPAHALLVALILDLIARLHALAHACRHDSAASCSHAPIRTRRYRSGKLPALRDWMYPLFPALGMRPLPSRAPRARRAWTAPAPPPSRAPSPSLASRAPAAS